MDEFDSAALQRVATEESTDRDVIIAGDDAEILDSDNGEGRPDDCQCWNPDGELSCWPCYREGFRSQNPNADTK